MLHVRLPDHLAKRGKGYVVRFTVPKEYRSVIGKKEIIRGLGTQDLGEAISKRDAVLAEIRETIRSGGQTPPDRKPLVNVKSTHSAALQRIARRLDHPRHSAPLVLGVGWYQELDKGSLSPAP